MPPSQRMNTQLLYQHGQDWRRLCSVNKSSRESQLSYGFTYFWSIRNNMEDIGRWEGEVSWGKSERETNREKLWTLRNKLRVLEEGRRGLGKPGGGY